VALMMVLLRTDRSTDLVDVGRACPGVRIELRYMTSRNGIGRAVYPKGSRCLLRRGTAERLARVQKRLARTGFGLKVWDAYRPASAQRALWEAKPDRRFVAPPARGSKHTRGAAVDLTLVGKDGRELPMTSDFDCFAANARSNYEGGSTARRRNRDLLKHAMVAEGFVANKSEWWHFHDPDWKSYRLTEKSLRK
jgi:D-alanyl-D-alanine dipeptidase